MSGFSTSAMVGGGPLLLDLAVRSPAAAANRRRRRRRTATSAGSAFSTAASISRAVSTCTTDDARRIGQIDRAADQRHVGAGGGGRRRDGVALLARRAIGEHAHRIERFAGRPRRDQDAFAGERAFAAQHRVGGGGDFERLGHAAEAGFAALGHLARIGSDECNAVGAQPRQIALRRLRRPHVRVHRRREQDRLVGREQHGGRQIVGVAADAILAIRSAVAGATTIRSVSRAMRIWPTSNSLCASNRSV